MVLEQGPAEVGEPVNWTLRISGMVVEYQTPAPEKEESETIGESGWEKHVSVRSNLTDEHYTNILVSTEVPLQNVSSDGLKVLSTRTSFESGEIPEFEVGIPGGLRLLWINGTEETFPGTTDVTDDPTHNFTVENGTASWTVPQLSEQNYLIQEGFGAGNISATVTHPDGSSFQAETRISESGTYMISLPEERGIKPGAYKLVIEYAGQKEEINFTWGLISVNTLEPGCEGDCWIGKSTFHPGEPVRIPMVVLDEKGYPSSRRGVSLLVIDPDGNTYSFSTSEGTVNETKRGVYEAEFTPAGEGEYQLFAKTTLSGQEVNITSSFLVKSFYEFNILRDTQIGRAHV